jgi:glycine/serine hydroxymethyltransferase
MKEEEAAEVARLIARTLKDDSPSVADDVRVGVTALTDRFRPYPDVR